MSRSGMYSALMQVMNMYERDRKQREREAARLERQQEAERKRREREAARLERQQEAERKRQEKEEARVAKHREKELIRQNPKIRNPREFELNVAVKLKELGFATCLTKTTGDQGVDVLATKNNMNFAIQCKLYSHPVGNKAVQEVCAGRAFYRCHYAVVVSNADFTLGAWQCARATEVILLKEDELHKLLEYV